MYRDTIRIAARCQRHRGYNPERDGLAGIRAGCLRCRCLFDLMIEAFRFKERVRAIEANTKDSNGTEWTSQPKPNA